MWRRGKHLLGITMNLWLLSLALLLGGPLGATGAVSQEPGYRLGPNDVIRIEVYGEDDLTVEGKISGDGKINFPLLGAIEVHAIEVQGQRAEDVREAVTSALAGGYVREPKVTVSIVRYRTSTSEAKERPQGPMPMRKV